jgi:hypothetical protein
MAWPLTPRSHLQMLVPLHYKAGGFCGSRTNSPLYDVVAYDDTSAPIFTGNVNSATVIPTAISGANIEWLFSIPPHATGGMPTWLFIHGHSGPMTDGGYEVYFSDSSFGLELKYPFTLYEEHGMTGRWILTDNLPAHSNDNCRCRRTSTTGEASCLLSYANTTSAAAVCLFSASGSDAGLTARGIIFSEDHALPMWDQGKTIEYSFGTAPLGTRTHTGTLHNNIKIAKSNQMIPAWSLSWSGLSTIDYAAFLNFEDAFGGNINRPFTMCAINADTTPNTMEHWQMLITSPTIDHGMNRDGEYYFKFNAVQLTVNY